MTNCNKCEDEVLEQVERAQSIRVLDGGEWRLGDDEREHWAKKTGDTRGPLGRVVLYTGACGARFWR